MNDHGGDALSRLRQIRDVLGEEGAPRRVNLRDYVEPGTPAWDAFVEASGVPGHKVRRATMLARINQAIDALTARLLGAEAPPEPSLSREIEQLAETTRAGLGQPRRIERQRLRRLTPAGIERARQVLADLRDDPKGAIEPPSDLLYDERYTDRFVGEIEIERRAFRTRRDAAEYFAPLLDETFVVDRRDAAPRSYQLRFRHYL